MQRLRITILIDTEMDRKEWNKKVYGHIFGTGIESLGQIVYLATDGPVEVMYTTKPEDQPI